MRYPYPVAKIDDYDITALSKEIAAAGLAGLRAVHIGGSFVVAEFSVALTPQEETTLLGVFLAHTPTWLTWTENGVTKKEAVRCADDVDRVTGQRIRKVIGGQDPLQTQLKQLRLVAYAHEIRLQAIEGKNPSAESVALAEAITAQSLAINTQIEAIRAEGTAFNAAKGWV